MTKPADGGGSQLWRMVRIAGLGLFAIMLLGVMVGFVGAHLNEGGGFSIRFVVVLGTVLLALIASGWMLRREYRNDPDREPLTSKERLNRNLLIASGLIGGVIGLGLALAGGFDSPRPAFLSTDPLPPAFAAVLVLVIGVLLPIIAFYWHRYAVDEQEADAYKTGALAALYLYMIGAPVWWFAWRGGFAPKPDGVIIYLATVALVGVIWLWKKYR